MTSKGMACRVVARSAFGGSSFQPAYAPCATARQSSPLLRFERRLVGAEGFEPPTYSV